MSNVINPGGIRAGCIYRIALRNFVTYKDVELFPGTSLNLIIGPNGTGKSTFVCAIILGLGGKTIAVGRAKNISSFVKHDCQEAKIEIELYQKPRQRNVIITRIFNMKSISTWKIDNETVSEKQVQDLTKSLHIQVDNLCQLLPQDKVQDFSQKTPQQRLHDTLATVGPPGSVDQLNKLILIRSQQRIKKTNLEKSRKSLEDLEKTNNNLKRVIDTMKERNKIEKEIQICDRKRLWIEYKDLGEKVLEFKKESEEVKRLENNLLNKTKPLENHVQNAKSKIRALEGQRHTVNTEICDLKELVDKNNDSIKFQERKLKDCDAKYEKKLQWHENIKNELDKATIELKKLNIDKKEQEKRLENDNSHLVKLDGSLANTNELVKTLKDRKQGIQYSIEIDITPKIRLTKNKINEINNARDGRLEKLRLSYKHTYEAVKWFRSNRNKFKYQAYEPMMLEINFTDPNFSRYLEATVTRRDLIAFTFESKDEMNDFLSEMRTKYRYNLVNAVQSRGAPPAASDIEPLRELGFYTYLVSTLSAPDLIMSFLCTQYNIHKIPIGNRHTYNNSDKVPSNIRCFYADKYKFSTRVSAYSGAISSSMWEVRPPNLLANTIDVEQLGQLNQTLTELEKESLKQTAHLMELDTRLVTLEGQLQDLMASKETINKGYENLKLISNKIKLQSWKIDEIESEIKNDSVFNVEEEKRKCIADKKDCVIKQCKLHRELYETIKKLHDRMAKKELYSVKLEISRNVLVDKESELKLFESEYQNIEARLRSIEMKLETAISSGQKKLAEVKQRNENKLPNDVEFPDKKQFNALPDNLQALDEVREELEAKKSCMNPADVQAIEDYHDREEKIKLLKKEIKMSFTSNKDLEIKMKLIKSQWLPELNNLIEKINLRFGQMYQILECAGEVRLVMGASETDFEEYGIDILVKYRAEAQLSRLTREEQSGGERAIATAVYLMSLQETSTEVPFRCVDEINQGMDSINERKMLQLLIKITTEGNPSQYFLLTPKLLKNLEYNSRITVHTVMNGKHIMKNKDWKYEQFLQNARRYVL